MSGQPSSFPHPLYEEIVLKPAFENAREYCFEPLLAANRAHVVMLRRRGIISRENARALLSALQMAQDDGVESFVYRSGVEDLFFALEDRLIERAGAEYGGNLQLARSRNDLGYALTRLALRPMILDDLAHLLDLRRSLHAFATAHLRTLMPGYTHTQPAQPTTMAHYIAGVLAFLQRDRARLRFAHDSNNQCPLGAAALTGSGFNIDRPLLADLLGFDGIQSSTQDSIGASDNMTDIANALSSLGVNLSRFTRDLLFMATQESGAIAIDDSFLQISSIMPQKRNPVVLEHLRARISRMLGQAHGVIIQCQHTPFGDTQDIEDEIMPPLFGALATGGDILRLYRAVIDTLRVNVAHLEARAPAGFTTATELADTLARDCGLPFRQAHGIVSALVQRAIAEQLAPDQLQVELLREIARDRFGLQIDLSQEDFERALDARAFVDSRNSVGGAAPAATANVLDEQLESIQRDQAWLDATRGKLAAADFRLRAETEAILSDSA